MNKNFRVGRIKFVSPKMGSDDQNILVDVQESCTNAQGEEYIAPYNLYLLAKGKDDIKVSRDDVGRYCEVGFYIQSFRDKEKTSVYENVLTIKSLRFITEEEAQPLSKRISKSILNYNN